MTLSRLAPAVALSVLTFTVPSARKAAAQAVPTVLAEEDRGRRDRDAEAQVRALAQEVLAFTNGGYKAASAEELLPRIDGYLARMHTLATEVTGTPAAATLADLMTRFERVRGDVAAVQARQNRGDVAEAVASQERDNAALQRVRALLAESVAAHGYTDLPLQQRLAALDAYVARLQALGPEVAGTRAAPFLENALREARQERASVAAQLARDPATALAPVEGPYTDFEWLGQWALSALTNPLQRPDFRASLDRGIDFDVGVSSIEPAPTGWLVQLSGRLGNSGTPGQGFFCRVAASDTASLAVLRAITPPYGIVHMRAPAVEAFTLQSSPLRIRIVFEDCRVTPPTGDSSRRPNVERGEPNHTAPPARGRAEQGAKAGRSGEAVAPSPLGLRCTTAPLRNGPQRAMAQRLRQAWAIPEPLRDDPTLVLTFAVTLDFDAGLQAAPRLLRAQSQRATSDQLSAATEAADRAIRETAPFPELGQFAGGTMQIDMTPCD